MALIEEGRICIKKNGRDAGSKAAITKVVDSKFGMVVTGIRPKERKCNVSHLEFLPDKIDIKNRAQLAKTLEIEEAKFDKKPAPEKKAKTEKK